MKFTHDQIERKPWLLIVLVILVVSIGGLVEIIPLFFQKSTTEPVAGLTVYSPLRLAGRDIYVREGCYNCHSQMIRPLRDEVERYGHYSLAAESMYDHPFQWGSKRTGPDLARVGGKYSDSWHTDHLTDPRSVVPESVMPPYAFLAKKDLRLVDLQRKMKALSTVGVPYSKDQIDKALVDVAAQSDPFSTDAIALRERYGKKVVNRDFDGDPSRVTEMDALIAYLQMLGTMVDFSTYQAADPQNQR
jgi:cytochrome c oxidase cbb3-type subunit 2